MVPLGPVASDGWMDRHWMLRYVMSFADWQVSKAKNSLFYGPACTPLHSFQLNRSMMRYMCCGLIMRPSLRSSSFHSIWKIQCTDWPFSQRGHHNKSIKMFILKVYWNKEYKKALQTKLSFIRHWYWNKGILNVQRFTGKSASSFRLFLSYNEIMNRQRHLII